MGRVGLVASLLLGMIFNLNGPQVIKMIEDCRESRLDTSRNFIPTPETNKQVKLIIGILGSGGPPIPNRDDTSCMKKIGKKRKKISKKRINIL